MRKGRRRSQMVKNVILQTSA
ncbi:hypothetical protein LINPERPRIM_LOCUS2754 [Linum perenne]